MRSVELFAGAGGSALGAAAAGFEHVAVVEWDRHSCDTLRANKQRGFSPVSAWSIHECDVRHFDYSGLEDRIDLLAGGPPCQPFSLGGKHGAWLDERDMFPELVRAVRELRPRAIMVENVKGLLRESFASYFEYIQLRLTYPELVKGTDENWRDHLAKLERHHTVGRETGLRYHVVYRLLNAADYGVPQRRERVFIVAFRSDVAADWCFPEQTHSKEALLWSQWETGEYWETHGVPVPTRPLDAVRTTRKLWPPDHLPWRTVRDALSDLPDPRSASATRIPNHVLRAGARRYPGHTGSYYDQPAKVLKAGDHGVPGGENMLAFPDGTQRYFTAREAARLQTFPEDYVFVASWTETMRQLGNAVPVELGRVVASAIRESLTR